MRKLIMLGLMLMLVSVVAACGEDLKPRVATLEAENTALKGQVQMLEELAGPPPAFLDRLFPPQAPAPILFIEMMTLEGAFTGLLTDLFEEDFGNLAGDMERFKAQYVKIRTEIVPEWQDLMPLEPLDALEKALGTGDPGQIMPAVGGVGAVCGKCHGIHEMKVKQKYTWPSFEEVTLTDPLTQQQQPWADYMLGVAVNFSGIGHNLQQGQIDNAKKSFQAFNARFNTLRNGCEECHDTDRTYFVDKNIQDKIDALGQALEATPPDGAAIGGLMQEIGGESCGKCHLVHQPAAFAQRAWREAAE